LLGDMTLTPWTIRYGYMQGAFPMGEDSGVVNWFEPIERAIFPMEGVRVSRSLKKTLRTVPFEITFDTEFERVIRCCRRPTDNWINEEIVRAFVAIHLEGWGHSCEVWLDGQLVGGTYGIALGSCFCAESMFHRVNDASKVALKAMIDRCRHCGFTLFDAEMMNPHLKSLGAISISQADFLPLLREALKSEVQFDAGRLETDGGHGSCPIL
jgi:leucyl/phenylalanyl-tRNA--protein transferase